MADLMDMTRAQLVQEAIVDGLRRASTQTAADIVQAAIFEQRGGQIIVHCPRRRLDPDSPAPIEDLGLLRQLIDEGQKIHGFYDGVIIEP